MKKMNFDGQTTIVREKGLKGTPEHCKRNGEVCAYRIRLGGGNDQGGVAKIKNAATACGYMYWTGEPRNCDPQNCTKWSDKLVSQMVRLLDDEFDIVPEDE